MLTNLLQKTVPEGGQIVGVPEAVLYALIGYLVVFAGIAFLIFIVWLVGKLFTNMENKTKTAPVAVEKVEQPAVNPTTSDDLDEETVAVIMAALTAYYENNYPKCEFTVKRIKRIRRNDYA